MNVLTLREGVDGEAPTVLAYEPMGMLNALRRESGLLNDADGMEYLISGGRLRGEPRCS